jgi:hypothetical protein
LPRITARSVTCGANRRVGRGVTAPVANNPNLIVGVAEGDLFRAGGHANAVVDLGQADCRWHVI